MAQGGEPKLAHAPRAAMARVVADDLFDAAGDGNSRLPTVHAET